MLLADSAAPFVSVAIGGGGSAGRACSDVGKACIVLHSPASMEWKNKMFASGSYWSQLTLAVLLCLFAAMAQAAGIKIVQIPSDTSGPALKAIIWTPCADAAQEVPMGPFVLTGRRD